MQSAPSKRFEWPVKLRFRTLAAADEKSWPDTSSNFGSSNNNSELLMAPNMMNGRQLSMLINDDNGSVLVRVSLLCGAQCAGRRVLFPERKSYTQIVRTNAKVGANSLISVASST